MPIARASAPDIHEARVQPAASHRWEPRYSWAPAAVSPVCPSEAFRPLRCEYLAPEWAGSPSWFNLRCCWSVLPRVDAVASFGTTERAPHPNQPGPDQPVSLNRIAARATTHCLTGCAIGEVLGMVIGTALAWSDLATIVLAVALAFLFGYSLTLRPLLRVGMAFRAAAGLALAADTLSITVMEIVDNAIMLIIPGAMDARLDSLLFWGSLAVSLAIAWVVAFPVNRWLIARGRGHAVVHSAH
jgi:hypothetical protein